MTQHWQTALESTSSLRLPEEELNRSSLLAELQSELKIKDDLVVENNRLVRALTTREATFEQREAQV